MFDIKAVLIYALDYPENKSVSHYNTNQRDRKAL